MVSIASMRLGERRIPWRVRLSMSLAQLVFSNMAPFKIVTWFLFNMIIQKQILARSSCSCSFQKISRGAKIETEKF